MSAPWATLQHAADSVKAGDQVLVQPGVYAGFYLDRSGAAGSEITFKAQPGVTITSENAETPDGINLEGASYVTIGAGRPRHASKQSSRCERPLGHPHGFRRGPAD
jgi:hypothetical protein